MAVPNRPEAQTKYPEQYMQNASYDETLGVNTVAIVGYDGVSVQRAIAQTVNKKITTSGSITYIGVAAPGTPQATAKWRCKKIDATDANNTVITWADGGNFSQVATDLTALTYA